jgi:hypothetical protein
LKRLLCLILLFLVAVGFSHAVEKKTYKDGLDFEAKLSANNVFLKECYDLEFFPAKNVAFFLDKTFAMIFKVELSTGKLLKTISNRGEGPFELKAPVCFQVKNNMVFVLDMGLNAIKIFDIDGKRINEFRLRRSLDYQTKICVNAKNEIFIGMIDSQKKTMVTVYDMKGNELRSFIRYKEEKKSKNYMTDLTNYYSIYMDSKENIYVLYYFLRKLAKYTKNGDFVWETKIKNELLDQYPNNDGVKWNGKQYQDTSHLSNMDITANNEIVLGHAGGGCVFGEDGKLKRLLMVYKKNKDEGTYRFSSLTLFKIRENLLMIYSFNRDIYIYK